LPILDPDAERSPPSIEFLHTHGRDDQNKFIMSIELDEPAKLPCYPFTLA
jgi:hypothetical protein